MHSPPTPHPSASSTYQGASWKPWSISVDVTSVRRELCGLLNKVTPGNIECIATRFSSLVNRLENSGESSVVRLCAGTLVDRCCSDPARTDLIAGLVQRAVDTTEGESLRWRSVDAYYVEDPATSTPTVLKRMLLERLEAAVRHEREDETYAWTAFAGELLVLGVISCDEIQDVVNIMFRRTAGDSDLSCTSLCRILRRVVASTEASHIIDALGMVDQVEDVLAEDTISVKTRYMMMSMLDHCLYPRPTDMFVSGAWGGKARAFGQRYERLDAFAETSSPPAALMMVTETALEACGRCASTMLRTRDLSQTEQFFLSQSASGRTALIGRLVSAVITTGDEQDGSMVASFLSLPSVRRFARHSGSAVAKAFEAEVIMLQDTSLDVPSAYRIMATLLHASALPLHVVEDLASRIVVSENAARDCLLEELQAIGVYEDDTTAESFPLDGLDVGSDRDEGSSFTSEVARAY